MYGIAKTISGYVASSIGVKIDVDNPGSRFLMMFFFTFFHNGLYFIVSRYLIGLAATWRGMHELSAAIANAILGVVLFTLMDRTKKR
jgi:rod shape-determining protein MreD